MKEENEERQKEVTDVVFYFLKGFRQRGSKKTEKSSTDVK